MHWLFVVMLVASLWGGWHWWSTERGMPRPPGVIAADEPRQQNLEGARAIVRDGYTFTPRARFDITARVLRKEIYRLDGGAGLAPVDLGVGWGPMSDTAIIDQIEFSQMGRFFYWSTRSAEFPLPQQVIATHAAQMHMVPADGALESRLKALRPGQRVTVSGWLVDIRGPGGFTWNTSLRRDDTGNGACEIVYVESLAVD
jgi:hypothetical protein